MMKKKPISPFQVAPSPSLSTIRDIREIRSLSIKVPSSLSNNQSPPPLSSVSFLYVFTIRTISEIRSFSNKVPSSLSNNQSLQPYRVYRFYMCSPLVQLVKFVVL